MTQFTPKGPMYCRSCEKNQIKTEIYFDNFHKSQSGKSIPLERYGGQPHQCPYSEYALKQNGAQRMGLTEVVTTTTPYQPQQAKITPPTLPQEALFAKIDNLNIGIAKIMSMLEKVTQLVEVIVKDKPDNFVPANQVQQVDKWKELPEPEDTTGYDNEVAEKIRRGKQADDDGEELEI